MAQATRATRTLDEAGIAYTLVAYAFDASVESKGRAAAEAIGAEPEQVFKTLMVIAEGKPACVVAPSSGEVSMKKIAAALGAKSASMMKPADAERLTGYKVGGISPLGQMRHVPTLIDETAILFDAIFLNGGQRGLQLRVTAEDLARILDARLVDVAA
ncbi:Cys-tRNA(Pro) deacylase [Novosphingobium sp. 1949]|uniref:Cys-tRNA(Pro)/Cys-tRNA(Cys) deacylase n=1 Tax=Novosphingobium organovorum TaxID=2930092 RepID=A0ABT0BBK3_9SPHN|nr:Cys-tRNA(Pro) deacylase [Novosphingobium organovorum]MCJ2182191.1 Cys-tRNA(Pro) deacylase [Novosphingobium organovorum]